MSLKICKTRVRGTLLSAECVNLDPNCCGDDTLPTNGPDCNDFSGHPLPGSLVATLANPSSGSFYGGLAKCQAKLGAINPPATPDEPDTFPFTRTAVGGATSTVNGLAGRVKDVRGFDQGSYPLTYLGLIPHRGSSTPVYHVYAMSRSPVLGGIQQYWVNYPSETTPFDWWTIRPIGCQPHLYRDVDGTYYLDMFTAFDTEPPVFKLINESNIPGVARWCAERVCKLILPCNLDVLNFPCGIDNSDSIGAFSRFKDSWLANFLGYLYPNVAPQGWQTGVFDGNTPPNEITTAMAHMQLFTVYRQILLAISTAEPLNCGNFDWAVVTYVLKESSFDERPLHSTPPPSYDYFNTYLDQNYKVFASYSFGAAGAFTLSGGKLHFTADFADRFRIDIDEP